MLKEVEGLWHKQFGRTPEVEALARSRIELPGNGIEVGLRESGDGCQPATLSDRYGGLLGCASLGKTVPAVRAHRQTDGAQVRGAVPDERQARQE